ncbi:Prolipoprotein diacylglyceryl transferase [bacterium HR40]|nr:Prolipoprotein diacylglyceryl transferase [bacterium HR40]
MPRVFFALPFPAIDPVAIAIGPIAIRWYALAYLAGLLLGWWLARRLVARPGWKLRPEALDDLLVYVTLGIVLGGRLGYVLVYNPSYYAEHPLEILFLWRGGMSFHGGLSGVAIACWLFARQRGIALLEVTDLIAAIAPLGIFFGRLANFINGELWGRPTDVPWAVIFPAAGPEPRHPSQLYEATLEGLVLFAILQLWAWRPRAAADAGLLTGLFLSGYGLARGFLELYREPDPQLGFLWGGLTMGQLLSLPLVGLGLLLLLGVYRKRRRALP